MIKVFQELISKERGFTLVGITVAMAISAYVIVSSLMVFISSMFLNEISSNQVIAFSDAQFTLEEIKRLPYPQITNGLTVSQFGNLSGEVIGINVQDLSPQIKEVTVNIAWTEKQRNRNYQLTTRIAR